MLATNDESELDTGDLLSGVTSGASLMASSKKNDVRSEIRRLFLPTDTFANRRLNFETIDQKMSDFSSTIKSTPMKSLAEKATIVTDSFSSTGVDDSSKMLDVKKRRQKLRKLFADVRDEFEKCQRITSCHESFATTSNCGGRDDQSCSSTASVSLEAKEEMNVVKNLNFAEICDVYEAECYKRLFGEQKIRLLQKRIFDLEQRLNVSNVMNERRSTFFARAETLVDEIVDEFVDRDATTQLAYANLVDENVTLKNKLQQLDDIYENLSEKYEKIDNDFRSTVSKLQETVGTAEKLQTENVSLKRNVETVEQRNKALLGNVGSLETEKEKLVSKIEELNRRISTLENTLHDTNGQVQRLKGELNAEKSSHRLQAEEIDRLNKSKFSDQSSEYEKRLNKFVEEFEVRKAAEIRRLKTEFETQLKLYDEMYAKVVAERDECLCKLRENQRCFDDNVRAMYGHMTQQLTSKYFELVSAFVAPPVGGGHSASASGSNFVEAKSNCTLADEFLDRLQSLELLSTPRRAADAAISSTTQQHPVSIASQIGSNNQRTNSGRPETLQQFSKVFGKSQPNNPNTPADPSAKF